MFMLLLLDCSCLETYLYTWKVYYAISLVHLPVAVSLHPQILTPFCRTLGPNKLKTKC